LVSNQPGAIDVSWLAADDGGSPISGYKVTANPGGGTCTTSGLACTVAGLPAGGTYTMSVVATNAVGDGPAGVSAPVSLAKNNQTASVKLPKKIAFEGKTTLLKRSVTTNAGQTAKAKVTVKPKGKKFAKVTQNKKGKVTINTKGAGKLKVTLKLSAPATAEFNSYSFSKQWKVKDKK